MHNQSNLKKKGGLVSQFERMVPHGEKSWQQALEATRHIAPAIRRQGIMNDGSRLSFSFSFGSGPESMEWYPS